jgi:hypothetical protein
LTLSLAPCVFGKLFARAALVFARRLRGRPECDTIDDIGRCRICLADEEGHGGAYAYGKHGYEQLPWHHSVFLNSCVLGAGRDGKREHIEAIRAEFSSILKLYV